MKRLHWYIARHYLGSSRGGLLSLITWIALGGVTVGVTALVVVIAVMTGMQEDLRAKILESTAHVIVLEQSASLRLNDYESVLDSVLAVPGVVGAAPFALSDISVLKRGASGNYPQPATMYGIDVGLDHMPATEMERQIVEGVLDLEPPASGLPPLLLGSILADRMFLFEGDTVVLMSLENLNMDSFGALTPTIREFEVTGTFTTGMYDYDLKNVYTTLEAAGDLIGLEPGVASGIGVRTVDPELAPEIALELGARLGSNYYVQSWVAVNRALFSALRLEKLAMQLILFLIVLVAAFNIVSTLVMVVSDRTREIGILKAMGMTRNGILRVFVLQGAWIGVMGTAVGTVTGLFLCWLLDRYQIIRIPPDVYFVDHLPVSVQVTDVVLIVAASVAVAFLATIYPSVQASRLEPVDAIRHE
ncbi:MAG: FtsX-like permease family protein [Gemmatimonadales bacterium]